MVAKTSSISVLILLCWLGPSAPCGARIGETQDQVLKRYGHCLGTVTADNGTIYKIFSRRGLKILVHFYENKVDEITYGKDADIFDDELKALMQDNAPGEWVGSGWPVNRWHNAAGISAHYSFERRLLMIVTDAALERERRRSGRSRLNIPDVKITKDTKTETNREWTRINANRELKQQAENDLRPSASNMF